MIRREAFLLKSRPRNRWFLVLAVLGILAAVEGVVRQVVPNPSPTLVAHLPTSGTWLKQSGKQVQTSYQGDFALHPFAQAPPGTRARVIWMGGSSIRGGTLPDLEAPSLVERANRTENLNLAAPGLDSGHFLQMLPEVLSLRPNAIVLYSGHNDRGNTIFRALANHRGTWDLRILGALSQVRLFQLLQLGLRGGDGAAGALPAEVQLTASEAEAVRSRYESNLRNLVRTARRAGVAVVLVTPASNPLGHPFAYQCPEELQTLGLDASHGNHGALDLTSLEPMALAAAQQRAPACRELKVFQARLNIVSGDKAPALEVLDSLRDNTRTPVQADRRTVKTIRQVASTEGASLADAALEFRRAGGGIEPPGWFWDPVHLRAEGHRALAAVVGPALEQALGLPPSQWTLPELPALTLDGRATGLQKQPPPDEMP